MRPTKARETNSPKIQPKVAGASGDTLVVVEAWESKAAQEQFMQSQFGPAFAETAVPQPTRIEWLNQIGGAHRD